MPTKEISWSPSTLSPFMKQAMVRVSPDIELYVEVAGNPENPPLLLIMGLGSQLIFWPEPLIQRLINAGFYVIRFDNRDIGLSTKIRRDDLPKVNTIKAMLRLQFGLDNSRTEVAYHLSDLADDTAALIEAMDLKPCHIMGASMGGMVAQILAAKYPHLVDRLAVIFSTNNRPFLPPPKPKQLYTLIKAPVSHQEEDIVDHVKWFIYTVGSNGYIDHKFVADMARLRFHRCFYPAGTTHQFTAILMSGSIQKYSKAVVAPTLVLHGSKDGLLPPAHGRAVAEDIPNATFKLIKGMSHDLPDYFHPFMVEHLKNHMLSSH